MAEAEIDLLRIRKLKASRFKTVHGNPETKLEDYSELNESLAKLDRYERRLSRGANALYAQCAKTEPTTVGLPR
jgi:hypothetical protein